MRSVYFFLLCFACLHTVKPQSAFQKTFGGTTHEYARVIRACPDGNYIIGCSGYRVNSYYDFLLVKVDAAGDTLWTKYYGGPLSEELTDLRTTSDGGFILTGFSESLGSGTTDSDFYILKVDSAGGLQWARAYGSGTNDYAYAGLETYDGNYFICGFTSNTSSPYVEGYYMKLNAAGDTIWTRTVGGVDNDWLHMAEQSSDSGFIMAGTSQSFSSYWSSGDAFVVKTDKDGVVQWSKVYIDQVAHECTSLLKTQDGGYAITGRGGNNTSLGPNPYLIKINSIGDTLWTRLYGNNNGDLVLGLGNLSDNSLVLCGSMAEPPYTKQQAYLLKINSSGDTSWAYTYGDTLINDYYYCRSVVEMPGGKLLAVGDVRNTWFGNRDIYLIQTLGTGISGCATKPICPVKAFGPTPQVVVIQSKRLKTLRRNITTDSSQGIPVADLCAYVSVPEIEQANRVRLYPNPSVGKLSVDLGDQFYGQTRISVKNGLGQELLEVFAASSTQELDLSHLSGGTYHIKVQNSQQVLIGSFILSKE